MAPAPIWVNGNLFISPDYDHFYAAIEKHLDDVMKRL